jgi:hypothetical protein
VERVSSRYMGSGLSEQVVSCGQGLTGGTDLQTANSQILFTCVSYHNFKHFNPLKLLKITYF